MKRSGPLKRSTGIARASVKSKKCKACRAPFFPVSNWQTHCRAEACAIAAFEVARAKRQKAEEREHRKKLADSKPLAHWLELTERVVNHFILTRDAALTCISCGTGTTVQWEAGHYRNVGSHPSIRFDLRNIHKQCHRCNFELSGNKDGYRIGLVERYGADFMDWLEGPHPTAKFTREALAEIRREAAAETRRLKKERT